jgi:sulfite reductase alpha subunit-like flavoprotein
MMIQAICDEVSVLRDGALVATGTGVTPYRAMLPDISRRLTQEGMQHEIHLLFGVRRRVTFIRRAPWFVTSVKAGRSFAGRWALRRRR